jgi:hypothetical protein
MEIAHVFTVRILMPSTVIAPEILEYPDSGKLYTVSAKASGSCSHGTPSPLSTGTASRSTR